MGSLIPAFNNQSYIARWKAKSNSAAGSMASMFPDEMGIGEEDKTVQLVPIYGSIAILYLAVAYIMFFRKSPSDAKKEDPTGKEGEAEKPKEEPKKDKKMKKKD